MRRWPLASDWYTDVINYVLRPARFTSPASPLAAQLVELAKGPLGGVVRFLIDEANRAATTSRTLRVAEALQTLWPDYPPVRQALDAYRREVLELYVPIYEGLMVTYGLRPHPGVDVAAISWAFNALFSRNILEQLAGQSPVLVDTHGTPWTLAAHNCLLTLQAHAPDPTGGPCPRTTARTFPPSRHST